MFQTLTAHAAGIIAGTTSFFSSKPVLVGMGLAAITIGISAISAPVTVAAAASYIITSGITTGCTVALCDMAFRHGLSAREKVAVAAELSEAGLGCIVPSEDGSVLTEAIKAGTRAANAVQRGLHVAYRSGPVTPANTADYVVRVIDNRP